MAGIGKKIKEAATNAAKGKGSGDNKKGKSTGGSGSSVDKAKRAVKSLLK